MKTAAFIIILSILMSCNGQKKAVNNNQSKQTEIDTNSVKSIKKDVELLSNKVLVTKAQHDYNFLFSPIVTYYNLLPVYFGAKENTLTEFQNIFSIEPDIKKGYAGIKHILVPTFSANSYDFSIAKALWMDSKYSFLSEYKSFVDKSLAFHIREIDFTNKDELAKEVNEFTYKETNNKIEEIISGDDLVNARMLIANAMYFKGVWANSFDEKQTLEKPFYLDTKKTINCSYLNKTAEYSYYENENYKLIDVPYENNEAVLRIILATKTNTVSKSLTVYNTDVSTFKIAAKKTKVRLYLPKVNINFKQDLNQTLKELDISDVFNDNANLSGMTGNTELYIDKIVQAVTLIIDEEGTEASAANVTVVKEKSASLVKEMNVNRPFAFEIIHTSSNMILLSGIINNPSVN